MRLRFLPVLRGYTTNLCQFWIVNQLVFSLGSNDNLSHNEKYHQCCLRYSLKTRIYIVFQTLKELKKKKKNRFVWTIFERKIENIGKKLFVGILSRIKKFTKRSVGGKWWILQILHVSTAMWYRSMNEVSVWSRPLHERSSVVRRNSRFTSKYVN